MPVAVMESTMTARELDDWRRFYAAEPWGEARADHRTGLVCSVIANVNRGRGKAPFSPLDFMPYARAEAREAEAAEAADPKRLGQKILDVFRSLRKAP